VSTRAEQVLQVYRAARFDDQLGYYERRRSEYERAHGQLLIASAVLLGMTSTASALAGVEIGGKIVWAILAAVLPALSTALAAYGGLFAFDRQAKLFTDAVRNLQLLEEPELSRMSDEQQADAALRQYVQQVEEVFGNEQAQWGQLGAEAAPGEAKPA
jgi:SMODS and SLOG-associating 2TM effector domain 1